MKSRRETWVCIADQRKGRILQIEELPEGGHRSHERGFTENAWEEHEHGRPSPRSGKSGHSHASRGHEDEEMLRRFAKQLSEWIDRVVEELRIPHLHVFVPVRFLGALRRVRNSRVEDTVTLNEGDLGSMTDGEVVRHRAVADLLGASQPTRTP